MSEEYAADVQKIMLQLEQRLQDAGYGQDDLGMPELDPDLRAHLVRLREIAGGLQMDVPLDQPTGLPILGTLRAWWRKKTHELVLFYVNSITRHQAAFAQAVVRSIIYLVTYYQAENQALRTEVEELRRELIRRHEE